MFMPNPSTIPTSAAGSSPQDRDTGLAALPCHDALELTQGGPVATICHDGQRYALRITRQHKLILTK